MAIYEVASDGIREIAGTSFSAAATCERGDLQRLLRKQIGIVSPDTLVVAEDFGEWEDSRRGIDLLGVDKDANLVVIELKRSEDGGHMEFQAIRYAFPAAGRDTGPKEKRQATAKKDGLARALPLRATALPADYLTAPSRGPSVSAAGPSARR